MPYHAVAAFVITTVIFVFFFFATWRIARVIAGKHIEMMESICVALVNQTTLLTRISEQNDLKERRHEDNVLRLEAILGRLETVCRHPETLRSVQTVVG